MESDVVLAATGVTKRFGGLTAVADGSLAVGRGQVVGLVGPNGAGKTTLLNCVAGLNIPDAGTVTLAGDDITKLPPEGRCRRGLARTFQIPRPFPKLTAMENVLVAAQFGQASRADDVAARDYALEMLDFVEFTPPPFVVAESLNAVELKRLDLARALSSKPKAILLDELAAGLMTGQLPALVGVIRRIAASGVGVVMVEHVMRTIVDLCDEVVVLHYGETLMQGTPVNVLKDPMFTEIYLGKTKDAI
jgi:branched-chain amino acid transport system ATP-binding protein